jgi:hypothetical protein
VYDAAANTWNTTSDDLHTRHIHSAALLAGGKVLVAGGYSSGIPLITARRVFRSASTHGWCPAGSMITARHEHTSTTAHGDRQGRSLGGYSSLALTL